jgi:hypothetical protein
MHGQAQIKCTGLEVNTKLEQAKGQKPWTAVQKRKK